MFHIIYIFCSSICRRWTLAKQEKLKEIRGIKIITKFSWTTNICIFQWEMLIWAKCRLLFDVELFFCCAEDRNDISYFQVFCSKKRNPILTVNNATKKWNTNNNKTSEKVSYFIAFFFWSARKKQKFKFLIKLFIKFH